MTEEEEEIQETEEETTCSIEEIQEMQEYKDKYLRLLAESENARKRMQKERYDLTNYAIEGVINEFLHPLDHFEKALGFAEAQSAEVKNWAIGFEMILTQFRDILGNHGVIGYTSVGEKFDPHLHEAVEMVETDEHPPGTVVEEFVKGYKMGDKTLRVARVKVAKEIKQDNQGESDE